LSLNTTNGLSDNYIYDLELGSYDQVLVATDNGVNICSADSLFNSLEAVNFPEELPDLIVLTIVKDHEGFIWFGFHQGGVFYYNPIDSTFVKIEPPDDNKFGEINNLTMERRDVWILDKSNGLFFSEHPHIDSLKSIRFKGEGANEGIRSVITDCFGNLWILTKKNLYASIGPAIKVIETTNSRIKEKIHSVITTKFQNYWLATGSKLVQLNEKEIQFYLKNVLNNSSTLTSLISDHSGKFWIGTLGQGIIVFDPSDGSHYFFNKKYGLINNNVLSIAYKDNMIWVATLGGVSAIFLDDESNVISITSYDKDNGLKASFIYTVYPDSKGRIWFGTDGSGLLNLEDGVIYEFAKNQSKEEKIIYSIIEDNAGNLWFSSSNSVLFKFDGDTIERFVSGNGFTGRYIYSLASDDDLLFILTDEGLNIFNYKLNQYVCLNDELGIRQIQSDLNSVYSTDKLICFATHKNVIQIDLDLIERQSLIPNTSLDWVSVNLDPVTLEENQDFSPTDNRFVFEYSGIWPLAPNKLHYMVKLEGYDPEWKNTYDRTAIYPNLPPGNYTFKVLSILNKTNPDGSIKTYHFKIREPFYSSVWFILVVGALLILVIIMFIKYREKRLKQTESRKKEKLEFEFQTLKNQVNPHFLFNSFSTLISIIEDNPNDAVEYTEALSGFFRNILEVKDEELIPLKEELRMLKNYSLIHQKRLGDNFKLVVEFDGSLNSSKIPPLTLQLLTENALKHNVIAKKKKLFVTIRNDANNIYVENNKWPKKIPEKSTSIGLKNIRERYRLITGRDIIVDDTPDLFRVILPAIK